MDSGDSGNMLPGSMVSQMIAHSSKRPSEAKSSFVFGLVACFLHVRQSACTSDADLFTEVSTKAFSDTSSSSAGRSASVQSVRSEAKSVAAMPFQVSTQAPSPVGQASSPIHRLGASQASVLVQNSWQEKVQDLKVEMAALKREVDFAISSPQMRDSVPCATAATPLKARGSPNETSGFDAHVVNREILPAPDELPKSNANDDADEFRTAWARLADRQAQLPRGAAAHRGPPRERGQGAGASLWLDGERAARAR